jgi:pilus assembly protein CpaC
VSTAALVLCITIIPPPPVAWPQDIDFHVDDSTQRLEMVVNTSRILSMDKEIPRVLVNNRDVVRVVPLSPTQVQVSALKAGVTQISLWDSDGNVRSVDVVIFPDARQLEMVLHTEFPKAAVRIRPLQNSVILTGYVDRPETIHQIVSIAEDYYPKVINNINVGGVQQVALHVKVMEVSRTRLRALGTDWAWTNGADFLIDGAAGLINVAASGAAQIVGTGQDTVRFGIVNGDDRFFGFIEALRSYNIIKVLAEPTLVTVSGRPASFQEGGEFPIIVPQSLGVNAVEFKQFGTRVDFVPLVLGNGNIRLEVRPQVSEVDESRGVDVNGVVIPGLRTRWVDTAAEMRAGQTLALAGLIQNRSNHEKRGLPWLNDLPWTGKLFGRDRDEVNEIELLVLVRPELVAALDPCQVPPLGPGERTTMPHDIDFYGRGYMEVPKCCPDPRCTPPGGPLPPYDAYQGGPYLQGATPIAPEAAPMPRETAPLPPEQSPPGQDPFAPQPNETTTGDFIPHTTHAEMTPDQTGSQSEPELFGPTGYDDL